MAIAGIFVYLAFALTLFIVALVKKDPTIAVFSSLFFIIGGLNVILHGFQDFVPPYTWIFGIMLAVFGAYVGVRAGIDVISDSV